jgi:hypothetical protein
MGMNNMQIDNTSYYLLPCGKSLEDFIWEKRLDFIRGSALKYYYRAGKKDGESTAKDISKCMHYCRFYAKKNGVEAEEILNNIKQLYAEAIKWNGETLWK